MNATRRVILVIYSLLLIAAAGGLIALAWTQDKKLDLKIESFNLQAAITSGDTAKYIATLVFAAAALIGFLTLVLAVLKDSGRRSKGTLRLKQTDGGTVEVTAVAIENLLRDELERLPEIRRVVPRVQVNAGAVDTFLDASIEPSASIAHVTTVLAQGVGAVLRDQVGVTNVRRPNVRISYDEANARPVGQAPRSTRPANPAPAAQFEPPLPPPPQSRPMAPSTSSTTMPPREDDGARNE